MNTRIKLGNQFRQWHQESQAFLMPNAWDAGSACILAASGFQCLATTSAGIAFSLGQPDVEGCVSRSQMMERIHQIASAVTLPVSADLEAGFGAAPEEVAETIRLAIQAGVVGGNIEDLSGHPHSPLFDLELAADRIRAARETADRSGITFTLTARTDCYLANVPSPFAEAVRRANRFREMGADCLFVPGVKDAETIAALVREIDGPLNVVMGLTGSVFTVSQLDNLGVKRISIGGSLARSALGLVRRAAQEMREHGSFTFAEQQIPDAELCNFFASIHTNNH
ncbi:MAG: PEP phosphonomutase [Comamonadaceae bacterium]|nr:MAG: PEP phosphonomutase [Comamonadaceae bacterium]